MTNDVQKIGHIYIPAHIMERPDLTLIEKVLYGKIVGLLNEEGFCFAGNEWLCRQIGVSQSYVSNSISKFVRLELLKREIIRNEKKEILQRKLFPFVIGITPTSDTPITPTSEGSNIKDILDIREDIYIGGITPTTKKPTPPYRKKSYLLSLPREDVEEFVKKFPNLTLGVVIKESENCYYYWEAKGRNFANYKATLRNWLVKHTEFSQQKPTTSTFKSLSE